MTPFEQDNFCKVISLIKKKKKNYLKHPTDCQRSMNTYEKRWVSKFMSFAICIVTIFPFIFSQKNKKQCNSQMTKDAQGIPTCLCQSVHLSSPWSKVTEENCLCQWVTTEKWDVMFSSICVLWEMSDLQVADERKGGRPVSSVRPIKDWREECHLR